MAALSWLMRTVILLTIFNRCLTWDNTELELFDLVEEVNSNFYDLLSIGQDASASDIRKAYRKLTLQLHPDKNKAEDAPEKFRQLVAVYEVLKDEEKRKMYNRILVEGLPDWRTPIFYYRRARKMGFVELSAVLALVITVGQYLFGWAVYIEQRLTLEDKIDSKRKKERKKKNKATEEAEELEEEMASLPRPSILDLWPFRLPSFLYWCVCIFPGMIKEHIAEHRRRKLEEEEEEEEETEDEFEKVIRKPKRRKMEVPEYSADEHQRTTPALKEEQPFTDRVQPVSSSKTGEWGEEELVVLAKAVNKFPGGTPKRWEKIANMVGRSVDEVCSMSKRVKGTYIMNLSTNMQGNVLTNTQSKMVKKNQRINDDIITTADSTITESVEVQGNSSQPEAEENVPKNRRKPSKITKTAERTLFISQSVPSKDSVANKVKEKQTSNGNEDRRGGGDGNALKEEGGKDGDSWTQNQQVIFEWALRHFPKGTDKRWDKIADQIPGKTKEDCIVRFKYLADLVKKKKEDNQGT